MSQSTYLQVWTMPLGSSGIVWDVTKLTKTDRLIPEESFWSVKSGGTASFRLLRRLRDDGMGDGTVRDTFVPFRGQYVAIVPGGGELNLSNARWVGCITDIPTIPLQGRDDELGRVTARELGWIFDQIPIRTMTVYDSITGQSRMMPVPSANFQGVYQGQIVGNRIGFPDATNGPVYYFSAGNADCSNDFTGSAKNFWTPKKLLERILADMRSDQNTAQIGNIPAIDIITPDSDVGTWIDTPIKEVIPLMGQTLGSLIDLLFGAARGLNWRVFPSTTNPSRWQLIVRSSSDISTWATVGATPLDVDLKGFDASLTLSQNGADQYDQVEVWGAPIVCCGTVSYADGTMAKGWTATQETNYNAGASASAGYGALTNDQKLAANNLVRSSGFVADVYQRFTIQGTDGGPDIKCQDGSGSLQFLCPKLTWDGASVTVTATSASPYLPTAKINRELPWPAGLPASGADPRSADQKATPAYLDPVVIHYDTNMPLIYGTYINLAHQPRGLGMPSPSIGIDNRGLAIRITLSPPHLLALGQSPWDGTGTAPAVTDVYPSTTYSTSSTAVIGLNYTKLMATIAMDSSQRLVVTKTRSGVTIPRNILQVQRPDMACWLVRKGTILGWTGLTATDKLAADTLSRNDYPSAQRLCDELSAWAFRPRQGGVLSVAISTPFTVPAWAVPGVVIGNLNEYVRDQTKTVATWTQAKDPITGAAVVRTLNTPITSIRQVWGDSPRYEITMADPPALASTSLVAGVNPWGGTGTVGGQVSVSAGGTPAAVMARTDTQVREIAANVKRTIPVDRVDASKNAYRVIISGGNDLVTIGGTTYKGIKYTTGSIASIPALDPVAGTTYSDGLGCGTVDGVLAWVVNSKLTQATGDIPAQTNQHVVAGQYCWATSYGWLSYGGNLRKVYVLWQ